MNANGPLPLETSRLCLRRMREDDLAAFQAYRGDADVGRWQGWQPMADAQARAFLLEMQTLPWCPPGEWFQLALADRHSDQLLGDMGLFLNAAGHTVDLGFTLQRASQGQGLASEAVQALVPQLFLHTPAHRVRAVADVRNTASVKLLERCGFKCYASLAATFREEPCEEHHFVRYAKDEIQLVLRAAMSEDAPAVAALMIQTRLELMPFAPSAHTDEETQAWVADTLIPGGGVSVATLHDAIVGVVAVQAEGGLGWIHQLMVHPQQVKRGIGRALLARALRQLPRPVQLWTFQANWAARRFYDMQGWRAVAFTDGADNEERVPDVLYRLDPA